MKIANFNDKDVPILGQPFKIMSHFPTVVVQCQCEAKTILCLFGVQVPQVCAACRNSYMIMDQMAVKVGAMRPEPGTVR